MDRTQKFKFASLRLTPLNSDLWQTRSGALVDEDFAQVL